MGEVNIFRIVIFANSQNIPYIRHMKLFNLFLIFSWSLSFYLGADSIQTMEGRIYRDGTDKSDLMYIQKEFIEVNNGVKTITHSYFNPEGEEIAKEWVEIDGGDVLFYGNRFNTIDTFGMLSKDNNNYNMIYNNGNRSRDKDLTLSNTWVAGPLLSDHLAENLEEILEGERIEFNLPFFDRLTTVPFVFELKEDKPAEDKAVVVFKLKNFLLGMLIEDIDFVVDRESGRVMEIHGPTILPDPRNPDSKGQVNANIYYTYL